VPGPPDPDEPSGQSERRNYAGRHRASASDKDQQQTNKDLRSVR